MELAKSELNSVKNTEFADTDVQVLELNDIQLALIGGGIADPIAY